MILASFTLLILGCLEKEDTVVKNNVPAFMMMDSFFAKYPNWNNNDVTRKAYTDTLNRYMIKRGIFDLSTNMPLVFQSTAVGKGKDKDTGIGLFRYEKYETNIITKLDYSLDVFAILSKAAIDTLKEGSAYLLEGETVYVKEPADISFDKTVQLPTIRVRVKGIRPFVKEKEFIILDN